jgi:hypothetical protein
MKTSNQWLKSLTFTALLTALTACGGGSDSDIEELAIAELVAPSCQTSDEENNNDGCGKLLLGVTDADGDFLNYTVNVSGLELIRNDGTVVSVITTSQSVNFVDYIEVSELAAAATIPAGVYTSGNIEIDYSQSDIQVEKSGVAVAATMVNANGEALTTELLALQFDENNRLVVARNRPAMLEVDFNLSASHQVDLEADPVTVSTEPYIVAEIDPVVKKEFRVRGPLIEVNQDDSVFRIAVRPFNRQTDRFGGVDVTTTDDTSFEINGVAISGSEGLAQLANLDPETATVTLGTFSRADDSFTAISVLAGSSVPGSTLDGAKGVIVARDGNQMTVKGASLIRTDGSVSFDDEINVLVSDNTSVSKRRRAQDPMSISDLSIGQAVTVLGTITEGDSGSTLDASEGYVRMRLTSTSGHSVSNDEQTLVLDLQSLQGRNIDTYDFTGTGIDPSFDADADAYEVSIEDLLVRNTAENAPIRVTGYVSPFGTAPADFNAISVTNYAESRTQIYVNWPAGDDVAVFSEITETSLILNTSNEEGVYKLIQGGIRTELENEESSITLSSDFERGFFTIKSESGISAFSSFSEFLTALQQQLNEGATVDLIHGTGGYASEENLLNVVKLSVKLN